jgi:hypothetical protein
MDTADTTDPTALHAVDVAHDHARRLRELARTVADSPTEHDWRRLRNATYGMQRWNTRFAAALGPVRDVPDELVGAHLALSVAVDEARHTVNDLTPLYRSRAVGPTDRPPSGRSRPFTVRYGGRCATCPAPLRPGQAAVYDIDGSIIHLDCDPT